MINCLGSIASIIGLALTVCTLIYAFFIERKLSNFSKSVLFNTRVSHLRKDFDNNISKLNTLFNDFGNNKQLIRKELNLLLANLRSIILKLPNSSKKQFQETENMIVKVLDGKIVDSKKNNTKSNFFQKLSAKREFVEEELWEIYGKLSYLSKVLDNLIKDKKII